MTRLPLLFLFVLLSGVSSENIVDRYTWGAKPASSSIPDMNRITDIVIGNDAIAGSIDCVDEPSCTQWMKSLQERDQSADHPDLKFHFYVSSQGVLFEGRGWDKEGGFTDTFAPASLGIAYLGDYSNGLSEGAESAIKFLIKSGYQENRISTEYCLLFTCDKALQTDMLQGPSCPGGTTYADVATWEPMEGVTHRHVYRPCGCGTLDTPSSAIVTYPNYDAGAVARYSCIEGYELIGESKRTCEISGSWSDVDLNPPQCVDPSRGLIIIPKKVWDSVSPEKEFIEGGFPIATFFVDVVDAYCVDDSDCRAKLRSLKKKAFDEAGESDVLCNFYIAKTGIVYEGRGWGVKGAYRDEVMQTQGICFLGADSVEKDAAEGALFKLVLEAQSTKKLDFNYCFLTRCPDVEGDFCKSVQNWNIRSDRPDYSNKYCSPEAIPADTRADATECRHKAQDDTWLNYVGTKSTSATGCPCLPWADQTTTQHQFYPEVYPYADLTGSYCRNPDMDEEGPWCITDSSCSSSARDSCSIPQCAPAVSFDIHSGLRYTLSKTKPTTADKLTMKFTPATLNSKLIRIEGSDLMGDAELPNFWEVSLVEGLVTVVMSMSHGNNVTLIEVQSAGPVTVGQTSEIQVLRKNHLILVQVNGIQTKYIHKVNFTDYDMIEFLNPVSYSMGSYILDGADSPFVGCMADVTFNKDNLLAVATDMAVRRGKLLQEGIKDDGCLAALPFDWSGIDLFTTPPPTTPTKPVEPITDQEEVSDNDNDSLPYIIIGIVILIILIILLIGCIIFKRHNKDKGVYNVDEATTTKWDWKKGILPVFTEEKKVNGDYDKVAMNNTDSPEVFA